MGVAVLCCVAVFGGFRWQFWSVLGRLVGVAKSLLERKK